MRNEKVRAHRMKVYYEPRAARSAGREYELISLLLFIIIRALNCNARRRVRRKISEKTELFFFFFYKRITVVLLKRG